MECDDSNGRPIKVIIMNFTTIEQSQALIEFTKKRKVSNISGFTTEELKEELKRRMEAEKTVKEENRKTESTCRNCAFLLDKGEYTTYYCCSKRTFTIKKYNRICNYKVALRQTCESFERKEN